MDEGMTTRQRNAAERERLAARRGAIETQVAQILQTVSTDASLTAEQKVRLAELSVELYHRF